MAAAADFQKKHPNAEKDMDEFGRWAEKRYGEDLNRWEHSRIARATERHGEKFVFRSEEMRNIMSDIYTLGNEIMNGGLEMGWGFNKDGSYDEWMSNSSVRHLFRELHDLMWDVRELEESVVGANQRSLERATLNDPNFKSFFKKLQDDTKIHSWDQLGQRVMMMAMKIEKELKACPYFKKMKSIVMNMKALVETRVVTEIGTKREWEEWWQYEEFENPFEDMEVDYEFLEDDFLR
jgi:hypothetical protein